MEIEKRIDIRTITDVLKEPYNFVFMSLLGLAAICLIVLFISLLMGAMGVASVFGWIGIIAAVADIILWILLLFDVIS